ncbi:MAG: helix-turn-helix domain-containing protein [Rhodobacteraceae bacterium]|nr:MAG: helix-turn-helix domain-containing protein [Paracoccaceae bacterium]
MSASMRASTLSRSCMGFLSPVRRIRLGAVRAALTDPARRGETITAVAERSGFHCAGSVSRAFKNRFGVSPRARRDEAGALRDPRARAPVAKRDFLGKSPPALRRRRQGRERRARVRKPRTPRLAAPAGDEGSQRGRVSEPPPTAEPSGWYAPHP